MGAYTSADDVQQYLQFATPFSATSRLTLQAVEALIDGVESEIDNRTYHAWRPRRVVDEYGTVRYDTTMRLGRPAPYMELKHWMVRPLDTLQGDKLEIWTGGIYQDWLLPATGKLSGRVADYFLEERPGKIFFMQGFPVVYRFSEGVRVTYRYGEYDVWGDVHMQATKMAAAEVLRTSPDIMVAQGGPEGPQMQKPGEALAQLDASIEKKFRDTSWIRSERHRFRISGGPHGR
jgi:hypothetical protein